MKKLILSLATLATTATLTLCSFTSPTPIPGTIRVTLSNPGWCSDPWVDIGDLPANATWVKVTIAADVYWWSGVEGLGMSSAAGYQSWDYQAWGRFPYPSELGTEGDAFVKYRAYWTSPSNTLATHKDFFDVQKCVTVRASYDPVGPYDGVTDYDGSNPDFTGSGGQTEQSISDFTVGSVITDSTILDGLKNGDGLYLHAESEYKSVFSGGSFSASNNGTEEITVIVTYGT